MRKLIIILALLFGFFVTVMAQDEPAIEPPTTVMETAVPTIEPTVVPEPENELPEITISHSDRQLFLAVGLGLIILVIVTLFGGVFVYLAKKLEASVPQSVFELFATFVREAYERVNAAAEIAVENIPGEADDWLQEEIDRRVRAYLIEAGIIEHE